ncbi:hypothetical protein SPBR_06650 [Sporothrix brasiliensis 5110]|uniref:ORP1 like protein n=1 Tax=Sporothrix brasiliensis 5110 TaxID=1398154 RepID=A0A0C2EQH2_9PEZI|nr:uncharacterized protein SPBR_06650 [Sporothrix brasiliensis 5110]KIH88594.1 hypothetical protein SPBR_06650 [Sporothrix brasiliensis 5110]
MMEHDSTSSSPTGPEQSRVTPDGRASSSEYQGHSSVSSGRMASTLSSSPMNMSPPGLAAAGHHSRVSNGSISDQSPNQQTNSATSGTDLPVDFETASRCMYRGDCQTGSQLRKAISHIFGRNKLCTRMIPTGVWVHYCRKHYQRTRYRNGGEYPQRQIGLVQEQIRRVQAWSDSNAQQSRGPVLKDWSLSVRKREQMRLDSKMAASGKKRPFHEDGMEDEEENFDEDRAEMSGTAVPEWVVAQIGDGFSTAGILEVVEHLKSDINQGRLQQIPDIEILPNIVTDSNSDEPASNNTAKKTYTKRRTASSSGFAAGGHRRSQSVNTSALRSDSIPMARRSSQPNNHLAASGRSFASEYHHLQPPMEKRQRIDGEGVLGMSHQHQQHHSLGGMSDRFEHPMAARSSFNSRVQLAHRPAFTGIRESHAESHAESHIESQASYYDHQHQRYGDNAGDFYAHQRPIPESTTSHGDYRTDHRSSHDFEVRREHERHHSTPGGSGQTDAAYSVLPAPNPQRFGSMPVAQQLESQQYILNSTSAAARRPNVHQRSQSEAGFMHHSSSHFERPTSSGSNALPPLQFNAPSRFTTDCLTGTNKNGCRHAEEMPRATDYPPYATHQSHASYGGQQAINASSHRVNYGHAHSHSMNHGPAHGHHHQHAHSYSTNQQEHSSSQYVYNSSNRYLEDGRNTQQQQYQPAQPQPPAHTTAPAYDPAVAPTQPLDKFEGVRLAPIQDLVQSLNPPVTTKATLAMQHTPTPGSDAVQTPISAPGATPKPGPAEGADRTLQSQSSDADYLGHPRQDKSSAVSRPLALTKETTSVAMPATYTRPISPVAHSISPVPQAQAQGTC